MAQNKQVASNAPHLVTAGVSINNQFDIVQQICASKIIQRCERLKFQIEQDILLSSLAQDRQSTVKILESSRGATIVYDYLTQPVLAHALSALSRNGWVKPS